jgi:hypothetical protein
MDEHDNENGRENDVLFRENEEEDVDGWDEPGELEGKAQLDGIYSGMTIKQAVDKAVELHGNAVDLKTSQLLEHYSGINMRVAGLDSKAFSTGNCITCTRIINSPWFHSFIHSSTLIRCGR